MLTPKQQKELQLRAQAEKEKRIREGTWGGGVKALDQYQKDPIAFAVERLGIRRETLVWSESHPEAYARHRWDGTPDPIKAIADALAAGRDVGVESGTGTGKAQPVDEPVLTPNGWCPIGDLKVGDRVIGRNGQPTEVLAVYPQGRREVFRLSFSDGASTRACAEHLWVMQSKKDLYKGCPWRLMETRDLIDGNQLNRRSLRVPLPVPVEFSSEELPVDPYLMGLILGDGGLTSIYVTITTVDEEIVRSIQVIVERDYPGLTVKRREEGYRIVGTSGKENPLTADMKALGVWGKRSEEKSVPTPYLFGSSAQRLAILQGLMDADGSASGSNKHVEFTSASLALSEAVVHLTRSLGGTANIRTGKSYFNGRRHLDRHRVSVNLPEGLCPFRLSRKAEIVQRWGERSYGKPSRILREVSGAGEEECVCIRVASRDSLYVTKDFIVTHNSHSLGWLQLWFIACWEGARVFSYAAKEDQLDAYSWTEIKRFWPRFQRIFPQAERTYLRIKMLGQQEEGEDAGWGAWGRSAGVGKDEEIASKAAGMHAEHMLILAEEAQGLPLPISKAIANTVTGAHNIRVYVGNPNNQHDTLHQFCEEEEVEHVRISALDHPDVVINNFRDPEERDVDNDVVIVPGAVSRKKVIARRQEFGENSPEYLSRVRGISPKQSEWALVRWEWLEAAAKLYEDERFRMGLPALGVDVAQARGGDQGAIAYGVGDCLIRVESFPVGDGHRIGDANHVGREVARMMDDHEPPILARYVGVDADGVGAGAANELKRLGKRVKALHSASKAHRKQDPNAVAYGEEDERRSVVEEETFRNLRAQMWWRLRKDLQAGRLAMPWDEELFRDLTAPNLVPGDVIQVEAKKDIRKRLERSTDRGDAVVYWNWVRSRRRIQPVVEEVRDPNEDHHFDEFWSRMTEARAGGGYPVRGGGVRRRRAAVRRRETGD